MPTSTSIATFLIDRFPELRGRVRTSTSPPQQSCLEEHSIDIVGTSLDGAMLGLQHYRPVEETIADTAEQILDLQRRKEWRSVIHP